MSWKKTGLELNRLRIPLKTVTDKGQRLVETVSILLEQVAFMMLSYSQLCSPELCLYKVKRGNFGITVQKYPHTQQHVIHKAPRLYYITIQYINSPWSVQCIIRLLSEIGDFLNLDNALTLYFLVRSETNLTQR